jgi:hypothetical protein
VSVLNGAHEESAQLLPHDRERERVLDSAARIGPELSPPGAVVEDAAEGVGEGDRIVAGRHHPA